MFLFCFLLLFWFLLSYKELEGQDRTGCLKIFMKHVASQRNIANALNREEICSSKKTMKKIGDENALLKSVVLWQASSFTVPKLKPPSCTCLYGRVKWSYFWGTVWIQWKWIKLGDLKICPLEGLGVRTDKWPFNERFAREPLLILRHFPFQLSRETGKWDAGFLRHSSKIYQIFISVTYV